MGVDMPYFANSRMCHRLIFLGMAAGCFLTLGGESGCPERCFESLTLPRTTNGLEPAWLSRAEAATVSIKLRVTANGSAENVQVVAPTEQLRNFTSYWIRQSRFSIECKNRGLFLTFVYKVYRRPIGLHLPAVTVRQCGNYLLEFAEALPPAGTLVDPYVAEPRKKE